MTLSVTVLGLVQGVGYRPFVARLARELGIAGSVRNSGGVVRILARGEEPALTDFVGALSSRCPPASKVTSVSVEAAPDTDFSDFLITESDAETGALPFLPADLPTCDACLSELADPLNRRYRYPFISCVDCGPRWSVMRRIPYDRATTTMDAFPMCGPCAGEYATEGRRRHAQTISCPDCGPQPILRAAGGECAGEDAVSRAVDILRSGGVLALKGIGGYQIACLPANPGAVRAIRAFKSRDRKPFAVMFPDVPSIRERCSVSAAEEALLRSPARPIVILERVGHSGGLSRDVPEFCPGVSSGSRTIGAFLPYSGLHRLLVDACGPLVMTSANVSGEPIAFRDGDMISLAGERGIGGVLYHKREIVTPLDDSVARVVAGAPQLIRRSRGFVPLPLVLSARTGQTILAAGGDLKASFCLWRDDRAYLSQYFGDMETREAERNYTESLSRMQVLFGLEPEAVACDLHPRYRTTALAEGWARGGFPANAINGAGNCGREQHAPELFRVQHHHAHIASVMAEHGLDSCVGVAFDGTGYGTDGAIWGGEFLLCRGSGFSREAHLAYVSLCGGDEAARRADLAACCYLLAAGEETGHPDEAVIRAALAMPGLSVRSSSMGRLFDAAAAVLGIATENAFEGECAIALENAAAQARADGATPPPLDFAVREGSGGDAGSDDAVKIDQIALIRDLRRARRAGMDANALALSFHIAVVRLVVGHCERIREKCGENRVALSGGVFANAILTEGCVSGLEEAGFSVYVNRAVPTNDGGICLGQAWVCAKRLNER